MKYVVKIGNITIKLPKTHLKVASEFSKKGRKKKNHSLHNLNDRSIL